MSYQVLALKYRPQTFDHVVGQPHVTTTLVNAIQKNRVAHAILFTGPRGTGKTTIARILAKALNCVTGPTPAPCNSCKTCTEIIQGHCADVFEIDGASNNSVDQVRDLRENITYLPASAPYKIYIIDEVHMLSTAAFNALLKTLEEPPPHVLFIFATTEVHKIPATILSRCQRHDLGRIPLEAISGHLADLCTREGFSVDREGLDLIAQEADGSIRDSLSLLDRVLSSADGKDVSYQVVLDSLGILDKQLMFAISEAVFKKDGAGLISCIEKINDTGLDLKKLYADIIGHFRNLNVVKLCGPDNSAVNMTENEKRQLHQVVTPMSDGYLGTLLEILLSNESMVKYASHTKTAIETVLLKLLQIRTGAQLDRIIEKLDLLAREIEKRLPETTTGPAPNAGNNIREPQAPYLPTSPQPETAPGPDISQTLPPPPMQTPGDQPPSARSYVEPGQARPLAAPVPEPTLAPRTAPPSESAHAPRNWQGFLTRLEKTQPFVQALLAKGRVQDRDPAVIRVTLHNSSAYEKKRLKAKEGELKSACREFLGKEMHLDIISETRPANDPTPQAQAAKAKHAAYTHPLVMDAQKIFNGEIINY